MRNGTASKREAMSKAAVIILSVGLFLWAAYKIVPALFVWWVVTHYFVI